MLRLFYPSLFLALCLALSGSILNSQDTQTPQTFAKPLANADVRDMLSAGLSPDIVIAKIAASACEFDTSPAALKRLKASNVPDAVILAMVKTPLGPRRQGTTNAAPPTAAWIGCELAAAVSVYAEPRTEDTFNYSGANFCEVFKVKCGDKITLLNPDDKRNWVKIRTSDGREGYISLVSVIREQSAESVQEEHPQSLSKKREDLEKANDDLEDCRVRSQNEYDSKINAIGTMALAPMVRVVAASRLKQNLDTELRNCRSQYESRLKATENKK